MAITKHHHSVAVKQKVSFKSPVQHALPELADESSVCPRGSAVGIRHAAKVGLLVIRQDRRIANPHFSSASVDWMRSRRIVPFLTLSRSPQWRLPLPFAYESTGEVTHFTNTLKPDARSRAVFSFHRPEELIRLARLEKQVRTHLREKPPLNTGRLWRGQIESIQNLESSLAANRPRALIQMATGT